MWSILVISSVLVSFGAAAPSNSSKQFDFKNLIEMGNINRTVLEQKLRAQAKERLGFPYPIEASCDVDWTFGMDCVEASLILTKQIKKWTGPDNCVASKGNHDPGAQDCMYQYFYGYEHYLYAMHQTHDAKHLDIFIIFFDTMPYGCYAWSYSYSSEYKTEILDGGRNYCNVWNLVDGCGLNHLPAYSRDTTNYRCTEFTTSNCSKH